VTKLLNLAAAALVALVLCWAVWTFATQRAQVTHCKESLAGLAVKEGTSGRIVCIRRDGVLKVYE
jgi:cytochrome b